MVLDDIQELVSRRFSFLEIFMITPIYDSTRHCPQLIVHKTRKGACLSLLLCKFVKGSPDLLDKVIEVSRPV